MLHAEQQDPDAADLGEGRIESVLYGAGGGPVGLGGRVPQGEQHIEVGDAGDGGATGDAAVEIAAVQPGGAEVLAEPRCQLHHHRRERRGHLVQGPLP